MHDQPRSLSLPKQLGWMAAWLLLVFLWEALSTPTATGLYCGPVSDHPWQGAWLSIGLLALSGYRLRRMGVSSLRLFIYGVLSAGVFAYRIEYAVLSGWDALSLMQGDFRPASWWPVGAVAMGATVWQAGQFRPPQRRTGRGVDNGAGLAEGSVAADQSDRLGIAHLFLLITCTAVYLGLVQFYCAADASALAAVHWWPYAAHMIAASMAEGAALGALVLFLTRQRSNRVFPCHPGEFLVVAAGVGAAARGAAILIVTLCEEPPHRLLPGSFSQTLWSVGLMLSTLIYLLPALHAAQRGWRVFFCCAIGIRIIFLIVPRMTWLVAQAQFVSCVAVALALLVAVILDLVRRRRYPWTHWLGIGLWFWILILNGLGIVLTWLVQHHVLKPPD